MSNYFSGRTTLVTGGTSGIGIATELAFARKGSTVIICGRNKKVGEKVPGFSFEDVKHWGMSQIPMKRFGQPEEVAKAVL